MTNFDNFVSKYMGEVQMVVRQLDQQKIENVAKIIRMVRDRSGRLFFIGMGGSSANASHAVNDFRKIAKIQCYCPSDNVSELTARANDDGVDTIYSEWLKGSFLDKNDCVIILSVGGGSEEKNVSVSLVNALKYAKSIGADTLGIVSRDGGFTAKVADETIIIPVVNDDRVTPHAEEFQGVILHLLVSHPLLAINQTKWESVK